MGLTGELVRSVFSKSRSVGTHDSNVRNYGGDKRRWSSVRSYLCGDEINSVLAEEDSASIRSSEATVTQPVSEYLKKEVEIQSEEKEEKLMEEQQNLQSKFLTAEAAAIVIQSAFREFLAKHRDEGIKQMGSMESVQGMVSPRRGSVGTSIEVQTGNSVEVPAIREESVTVHYKLQQKARTQVSRLKEDWDDSTLSSNISKLRIQNRLEATTRRERALAYAFSQQLRICSKKKPSQTDNTEPNMGWNWLERWMATRLPENSMVEDRMSKWLEPISSEQKCMNIKKSFDLTGEEKESCGSNEVSVGFDSFTVTASNVKEDSYKPVKNRLKATRSVSRRKTMPSYQCPTQFTKVSKKDGSREAEKDKKHMQMQPRSFGEIKQKDVSSQATSVTVTNNSSKWDL